MGSCCIKKMRVWTQSGGYQQPNASAIDWTPEICVLAQSQWRDAASILLKFPLIHSLFPCFSFLFCFSLYPLRPSMPSLHFFHTSFVSFNYSLSCLSFHSALFRILNLSSSSFLTSFLHWPTASVGSHTLHNSISVFLFFFSFFLPLCDLGSILALERRPTLNPCSANIEQSFNLCDLWHHRLV